tara:strand:- start:80 stop:364 length:285 start_codon:yes stop_codon:yes gene_type:complete
MGNLSKIDKRNLKNLTEQYNAYLGGSDQAQWLAHFFNNPVGSWIRSSSGTAVRTKRVNAIIATFPNITSDAARVMEKARVSEFTISQLTWTPAS